MLSSGLLRPAEPRSELGDAGSVAQAQDPAPSGGGERAASLAAAGEEESPGEERALVIHSQAEEQEYKCPLCGERFQQQPSLTRHQKLHAAERAYICPECGKPFGLRHNLLVHQRTHTGEKPFPCAQCGRSFSLKQNLLTHQRTHAPAAGPAQGGRRLVLGARRETGGSPTPPFVCPDCGKGFSGRSGLAAHRRTHAGETAFTCIQCRRRFSQKGMLEGHQCSHLPAPTLTCPRERGETSAAARRASTRRRPGGRGGRGVPRQSNLLALALRRNRLIAGEAGTKVLVSTRGDPPTWGEIAAEPLLQVPAAHQKPVLQRGRPNTRVAEGQPGAEMGALLPAQSPDRASAVVLENPPWG